MDDARQGMRRAEKLAGIVAIVAALVVLNGAWMNQHNWENVSWRVAVAAVLVFLAIIVETNAFGVLRARERKDALLVPDFMRFAGAAPSPSSVVDGAESSAAEVAATAERR